MLRSGRDPDSAERCAGKNVRHERLASNESPGDYDGECEIPLGRAELASASHWYCRNDRSNSGLGGRFAALGTAWFRRVYTPLSLPRPVPQDRRQGFRARAGVRIQSAKTCRCSHGCTAQVSQTGHVKLRQFSAHRCPVGRIEPAAGTEILIPTAGWTTGTLAVPRPDLGATRLVHVGLRTLTPGRPSKPSRSDVTTVRPVATAVAAMMRSWAPRGLPAVRTATRSFA